MNAAGQYNITQSGTGQLWTVNVNTTGAGSVTLYDGQTSFGTSKAIAKVDTGNAVSRGYAVIYTQGLTVVQVGSADVTVGYE